MVRAENKDLSRSIWEPSGGGLFPDTLYSWRALWWLPSTPFSQLLSVCCHQARSSQFEVGGRRFPGVLKTHAGHTGTAVLGAPAPWGFLVPGGPGAGHLSHWQHWTTCSLGAGTEAETSWKQQVITAEVTGEEKGGCGGPLWSHVRVVRGCRQARGAPTDPGRELSTGRRSCRQLLLYSTTGTPNSKMGFKTWTFTASLDYDKYPSHTIKLAQPIN